MERAEVSGVEFDWFAVDKDNHVAVFSSAGYGEIPSSILDGNGTDDWAATEEALIKQIPPMGKWFAEGKGPGSCEEWKELAAIGIYVFDWIHWDGPYERVLVPTNPIRLAALPQELQWIFQGLHIDDLCFGDTTRLQVEGVRG